MTKLFKKISAPLISLIFLLNMSSAGMAETTVSAEVGFIFNTLLFLICGFLVMFMAAGFAMLESGMVTSKSVASKIVLVSKVLFRLLIVLTTNCFIILARFN